MNTGVGDNNEGDVSISENLFEMDNGLSYFDDCLAATN